MTDRAAKPGCSVTHELDTIITGWCRAHAIEMAWSIQPCIIAACYIDRHTYTELLTVLV